MHIGQKVKHNQFSNSPEMRVKEIPYGKDTILCHWFTDNGVYQEIYFDKGVLTAVEPPPKPRGVWT